MSENERKSSTESEQAIATVFEAAGYEVSQNVGTQPGEVDWFARPKTGLERPTTYWQVWDACPAALDDALLALEETRKSKGADRALAVINRRLPAGYETDLQWRPGNTITVRRLFIELLDGVETAGTIASADAAGRGDPGFGRAHDVAKARSAGRLPGDAGEGLACLTGRLTCPVVL